MQKNNINQKKNPLGFTFSFPCLQSKLDEVQSTKSDSYTNLMQPSKVQTHLFISPLEKAVTVRR